MNHKPNRSLLASMVIKIFDVLGKLFHKQFQKHWTVDELIKRVERETGLSWDLNQNITKPLTVLIDSFENESKEKHFIAKLAFYASIHRLIRNRLFIKKELETYPETTSVKIQTPLFIVGLPRTGTTFLQNLLCQDPNNRGLYYQECLIPCPPPEKSKLNANIQQKTAKFTWNFINFFDKDIFHKHAIEPNSFEECFYVLENSFNYRSFTLGSPHILYMRWLDNHPEHGVAAYIIHKQTLQILQRRENCSRWVLKSPHHLLYLNELFQLYPDACLVHTHRDPVKIIPSFISLVMSTRGIFAKYLDVKALTVEMMSIIDEMVNQIMILHKSSEHGRFYDIDFLKLVKDPVKTIKDLYDFFQFEFSNEFETNMHIWLELNKEKKRGIHDYSLTNLGLSKKMIENRYKHFYDFFSVQRSD